MMKIYAGTANPMSGWVSTRPDNVKELGQCRNIAVVYKSTGMVIPHNVVLHESFAEVIVQDAQFPVHTVQSPIVSQHEVIISVLVSMMGGSVVIHPFEMLNANRIEVSRQQDPALLVLKVKE